MKGLPAVDKKPKHVSADDLGDRYTIIIIDLCGLHGITVSCCSSKQYNLFI